MAHLLFISLSVVAATLPSSSRASPSVLHCISGWRWGCSDDGICIDSRGGIGQHYSFDLRKMVFSGPKSSGTILDKRTSETGHLELLISDGRRLVIDADRYYLRREKRTRIVSRLFDGNLSNTELECR